MTIGGRKILGGALQPVYIAGAEDGTVIQTEINGGSVEITGVDVPLNPPVVGQVTIAVTGTAVRLVADSLPLPGGSVLLWASEDNTDPMTAGRVGLGNEADGTGDGVVIPTSGNARIVFAGDLRDVWVNGTAGDWLSYSAG